ncbi:MAG: hypothetical protein IH857_02780 [Deltaproteobacteria bacterium]|nr:hypothetical protein [Deltaproteobacteria bacterium]
MCDIYGTIEVEISHAGEPKAQPPVGQKIEQVGDVDKQVIIHIAGLVAFIRDGVAVAVIAESGGDVNVIGHEVVVAIFTEIRDAVSVAVARLAFVGNAAEIAIATGSCGKVIRIKYTILVAILTRIGDTITTEDDLATRPLPGFTAMKPMVFSGLYPADTGQYQALRKALERLRLNDSSFTFEAESSQALGFGFRCGFLGLLHLDIVRERLEREFGLSLITTAPTVVYQVITRSGKTLLIDNPDKLPAESDIDQIEETVILATIHVPQEFLGSVLKLCEEKRGTQKEIRYLGPKRAMLVYELPLSEIALDFYDRLKSLSRGYASMDYEVAGRRPSDMVKLDIRINGEVVDAMSMITHREKAYQRGRDLVQRMRGLIPRQLFEVVIQAAIGSRVIARESVKALRKNVTAKCYGGDITRKRKLLERQKEGKKRMKQVGRVEIPQEAFLAALKV